MHGAAVPRRGAVIHDVSDIVAHHRSADMQLILHCSKTFYEDDKLLRAMLSGMGRPQLLASAIRASASVRRVDKLVRLHTADLLNKPLRDGRTLLQRCVANIQHDYVRSILTIPGVAVADDLFGEASRCTILHRSDPRGDSAASACAEALASSPACDPSTINAGGRSNLSLAAEAGLVDVVRRWLRHERCTAELLKRQDDHGHTAFTGVCNALVYGHDSARMSTPAMARLVYCAKLLAWDSRNSPAWTGPHDNTQLGYAAAVRLGDVLERWVKDTRTTTAVMEARFSYSSPNPADQECTVLGAAFGDWSAYMDAHALWHLTPERRREVGVSDAATCINILATHEGCNPAFKVGDGTCNFVTACHRGAVDAVSRWVRDPRITEGMLHGPTRHNDAWATMCSRATRANHHGRVMLLQALETLATHPAINPSCAVPDAQGTQCSYLAYACRAGAPNVVRRMLADPRCPPLSNIANRPLVVACLELQACGRDDDLHKWLAVQECARLVTQHPDCRASDEGEGTRPEPCNFWYACWAGLADIVGAWAKRYSPGLVYNPAEGSVMVGTAFGAVSEGLLQLEGHKDSTTRRDKAMAGYQECARLLASMPDVHPHDCSVEAGDDDTTSRPNMDAACAAGLTDIVAQWLPKWDAAKELRNEENRIRPADHFTAFGNACVRAADPCLTPAQAKTGAACARLLFQGGTVAPQDYISDDDTITDTAFTMAAKAGLDDIVQAWSGKEGVSKAMLRTATFEAAQRVRQLQESLEKAHNERKDSSEKPVR